MTNFMKRKAITLIAMLLLALCVVGCGDAPQMEVNQSQSVGETVGGQSSVSSSKAEEPTKAKYPENYIKRFDTSSSFDEKNFVLGNENYLTIQVKAIEVLATTKDAPQEAWEVQTNDSPGKVLAWVTGEKGSYTLYIAGEGGVSSKNPSTLFANYSNAETINFNKNFYVNEASSLKEMFYDDESVKTLDLSGFDTSKVTGMEEVFSGCEKLESVNLSSFNTSKVTSFKGMFYSCRALTSLDVSNFDTSKATSFWEMFEYCQSLTSLDLSNFDSSNVTDMAAMFTGCKKLSYLNISKFNTSKVKRFLYMFMDCSSLSSFEGNLEIMPEANVKDMYKNSGLQ